jgi:hypothetical protein
MNKQRRKQLAIILSELENSFDKLTQVRDDEQEAFDNLPESLQWSEKGSTMEDTISALDDVLSDLDTVIANLSTMDA